MTSVDYQNMSVYIGGVKMPVTSMRAFERESEAEGPSALGPLKPVVFTISASFGTDPGPLANFHEWIESFSRLTRKQKKERTRYRKWHRHMLVRLAGDAAYRAKTMSADWVSLYRAMGVGVPRSLRCKVIARRAG